MNEHMIWYTVHDTKQGSYILYCGKEIEDVRHVKAMAQTIEPPSLLPYSYNNLASRDR